MVWKVRLQRTHDCIALCDQPSVQLHSWQQARGHLHAGYGELVGSYLDHVSLEISCSKPQRLCTLSCQLSYSPALASQSRYVNQISYALPGSAEKKLSKPTQSALLLFLRTAMCYSRHIQRIIAGDRPHQTHGNQHYKTPWVTLRIYSGGLSP